MMLGARLIALALLCCALHEVSGKANITRINNESYVSW